jgi:hypothetical protein
MASTEEREQVVDESKGPLPVSPSTSTSYNPPLLKAEQLKQLSSSKLHAVLRHDKATTSKSENVRRSREVQYRPHKPSR